MYSLQLLVLSTFFLDIQAVVDEWASSLFRVCFCIFIFLVKSHMFMCVHIIPLLLFDNWHQSYKKTIGRSPLVWMTLFLLYTNWSSFIFRLRHNWLIVGCCQLFNLMSSTSVPICEFQHLVLLVKPRLKIWSTDQYFYSFLGSYSVIARGINFSCSIP